MFPNTDRLPISRLMQKNCPHCIRRGTSGWCACRGPNFPFLPYYSLARMTVLTKCERRRPKLLRKLGFQTKTQNRFFLSKITLFRFLSERKLAIFFFLHRWIYNRTGCWLLTPEESLQKANCLNFCKKLVLGIKSDKEQIASLIKKLVRVSFQTQNSLSFWAITHKFLVVDANLLQSGIANLWLCCNLTYTASFLNPNLYKLQNIKICPVFLRRIVLGNAHFIHYTNIEWNIGWFLYKKRNFSNCVHIAGFWYTKSKRKKTEIVAFDGTGSFNGF